MSAEIKAQIADLQRSKHDWEEGENRNSPFPLDDLISELEAKVKPKRRKG